MHYTHEKSDAAPRLALFLNSGNLTDLPESSIAPRGSDAEVYAALREAGFEGIQGGSHTAAAEAGLKFAELGRVNAVGEIDDLCKQWNDRDAVAATLHVGWGWEDDAAIDAMIGDVLDASARHDLPLYVETHRATVMQDMWRTVEMLKRHPDLGVNGDFSHWYTGQEMKYAGVENCVRYIAPVFERVGFMHGRIGNSGNIQVDAGRDVDHALTLPHVRDFLLFWTESFREFKKRAGKGDYLIFAPELLCASINYARLYPNPDGTWREETDRYQQALLYQELARHCFDQA